MRDDIFNRISALAGPMTVAAIMQDPMGRGQQIGRAHIQQWEAQMQAAYQHRAMGLLGDIQTHSLGDIQTHSTGDCTGCGAPCRPGDCAYCGRP